MSQIITLRRPGLALEDRRAAGRALREAEWVGWFLMGELGE